MYNPLLPVAAQIKVDPDKTERFHKVLTQLREINKKLSKSQHDLRLQRKPSRGKINKDRRDAIKITAVINLSRDIRGLSKTYTAQIKCRCCGHIREEVRSVHNIPQKD